MGDSSLTAAGETQQSPTFTLGRPSTIADSASVSDSDGDESNEEDVQVNGSKKRKRSLKISCELCKARKVKCDRLEPSCGWCARNNRSCVYQERKKPGLRVGYGRELEDKINRLEAILQLLGRRVEDHIFEHDQSLPGPVPLRPASPRQQFQSPDLALYQRTPRSTNDGRQSPPILEPILDTRWESNTPYAPTPYSRAPDAMSIRSMVGASGPDGLVQPDQATPTVPSPNFGSTAGLNEQDLPPSDLLYTLVDLYFKHVNTWSPILDRNATFEALFGPTPLAEADWVLLHAIVATTLRFSKDLRLTPASRKQYHDFSKQKVQIYGLEHPNVRALQALVIIAVDTLGTSNGPPGWNLLALIARNIVLLGLGVEKSIFLASPTYPSIGTLQAFMLPQPKTWIEDEERRRLFWMIYVLDRYATVATAYDFTLDEKEMDRTLPCRYDLFSKNEPVETKWFRHPDRSDTIVNKPENLGSFAYHCEVLRILSRIHKFLTRPIDISSPAEVQRWRESYRELDGELTSWLQNLPGEYGMISQLCHSDPASKIANWIMLHAAFVTSVIRLHSSAAYPTVLSHIFTPSHNAMQRCLAAVESLRGIAQDVVNTGALDLLGPPFAFSLWVSARVLLVHAATMECTVDPNINFFIATLESMGQYWEVARSYAEILKRVVDENQQNQNNPSSSSLENQTSSYSGSATINTSAGAGGGKTFTAMRRHAYDLNLLLSQRPLTVLDPTSTRTPSLNELEYLDVFDFFNYPRVQSTASSATSSDEGVLPRATNRSKTGLPYSLPGGHGMMLHQQQLLQSQQQRQHLQPQQSEDDYSRQSSSSMTTRFATPNPESDWLVFKPPHD